MSTLITRRKILQGMFAMPAIVAVGNIMPISVIESWDLDRPTEDWVLIGSSPHKDMSWIRNFDFLVYYEKHRYEVYKEAKIHSSTNPKTQNIDMIKQLNAIARGSVVTDRLPSTMMSYESTRKGILMPEGNPQIIAPKSILI